MHLTSLIVLAFIQIMFTIVVYWFISSPTVKCSVCEESIWRLIWCFLMKLWVWGTECWSEWVRWFGSWPVVGAAINVQEIPWRNPELLHLLSLFISGQRHSLLHYMWPWSTKPVITRVRTTGELGGARLPLIRHGLPWKSDLWNFGGSQKILTWFWRAISVLCNVIIVDYYV